MLYIVLVVFIPQNMYAKRYQFFSAHDIFISVYFILLQYLNAKGGDMLLLL